MAGYVLYSVYVRLRHRTTPTGRAALVVLCATLLPDLVDKPLAWQLGLLPSGRSLAHSLLVGLPTIAAAWSLSRVGGWPDVGPAFAIGYLSHVATDAVYPVLLGEGFDVNFLLWPLLPVEAIDIQNPFARVLELGLEFGAFVLSDGGWRFVVFESVILVLSIWLWVKDGMPGLRALRARRADRSRSDHRRP